MPYAELHCLSNFSFLEAASHPEELVARAAELGYSAIAITDRNSLSGVVRAHTAAKNHSIKLIIGSEIHPLDSPPIVLWATDRVGYGNLCSLITVGRRRAAKGECSLSINDIAEYSPQLIAGILPPASREEVSFAACAKYQEIFKSSCYLLANLYQGPHDHYRLDWLKQVSRQTGIPPVAAGNVLFHVPLRKVVHDVLTAIRHQTVLAKVGKELLPNAHRHLRKQEEIQSTFSLFPEALHRTLEIADQCNFSMDELRYEYPEELAPTGLKPIQHLRNLTWEGANKRYNKAIPDRICKLIEHELELIADLHYEPYFLTVYDLVRFAKSRNILCQGRGSAANSVVCYCLGVTSVDPTQISMLFERFISRERDEAPDIDVDFEHERREEVLQYIYEKYGRNRSGLTAVTITYRPRSAIRDVGKALGLSTDLVDRLAKNAGHHGSAEDFPQRCREAGLDTSSLIGRQLIYLVKELIGFPRHLSQHVGGMVITQGPLHRLVPLENAAMPRRTVVAWNKDDLDALGILKVDCLALGMLTAIRKCFALILRHRGIELFLGNIPQDDTKVYDMICRADTIGVFQIESRAQMSMLPRLKPRCYYDLVIEVAIVRPGPIQGNMVHPYLRRRQGEEVPNYPNEEIRNVLEKTLGVPLFQEQCMQLAVVAAGFTPGEADQLRRAMAAWRRTGVIEIFHQKLILGMKQRGLAEEFAEQVFQQIRGFSTYGFPESHAASFALLVYVSSWLKNYYPAEFAAAIINSQPMGFYAPSQLIQDAKRHGVHVLPVDINHSDWDCTMEETSLRLGLRLIIGLQQTSAEAISKARQVSPFLCLDDFVRRANLNQSQVTLLAEADALCSLQKNRRQALWNAFAQDSKPRQQYLFDKLHPDQEPSPILPRMTPEEEVYADFSATHLSLRSHPMAFQRERLNLLAITCTSDLLKLPNNSWVRVAGIVLLRQRPSTAKGITFVTLEDETGTANLIFHKATWDYFRTVTRHSQVWIVHGNLESKDTVVHVVVRRVEDLTSRLKAISIKSRDFR